MKEKIRFDAVIIGGLGRIGLPLGLAFAKAGLRVGLYDKDATKRQLVRDGIMPFMEDDAPAILQHVIGDRLHVLDDLDHDADTFVITIGTPVDAHLDPELLPILNVGQELVPHLKPGQHVMVRSTVFPGTTRRLQSFFDKGGMDVNVSCCPERVVQGQAIREMWMFPQIVAGCTPQAEKAAAKFFSRLGVETVDASVEEAELAKLFCNAWRYIQFAIANQFFVMAAEHDVDFYRVYDVMTKNYARAANLPSAGFTAGPCLFKDTLQLSAFHQNKFYLGHAAMLINEGLPGFLIDRLKRQEGIDMGKSTVGVLGMAFKANTDDTRGSLSYKLVKMLRFHGAEVLCSDEYVRDPTFVDRDELIRRSDVIIIATPHAAYRSIKVPPGKHVVDVWRLVGERKEPSIVADHPLVT